jgi:TolB-like protein
MAYGADSPRVSPVKRYYPLFLATLLLSTLARAQTPAPAGEQLPSSSNPAAPAEAAPTPPAQADGTQGPDATPKEEGAQAAKPPPEAAPVTAPAAAKPEKDALGLPTVAVLSLEANKPAEESAPGIASLIASRMAESPKLKVLTQADVQTMLSTERQRQLLGSSSCSTKGPCLEELSNAIGARYVVTGRLDRFGDKYLLTVSLLDTFTGRSLARPRAEASSSEDLLQIADAVGDQLLAELAPEGKTQKAQPLLGSAKETPGGGLVLGLRINNSFISNIQALNPGGDVELGYAFHPEWVGFLQVGITFIRATEEEASQSGRVRILPSVLGARHYYRLEHSLRPYWGLGLGVQLAFGQFGIFQSTGPLPTVMGFFGAEYIIADRVGLQLELGTNLAQATLGLADNGLGDGLNLDLSAGISYHF